MRGEIIATSYCTWVEVFTSLLFLLISSILIKLGTVTFPHQFKQHLEPTKMTYSSNHLLKRDFI